MITKIPEISKQIQSEKIREILDKNFVSIIPVWAPLQLAWINNVYRTFYDYEKFMIIMYLLANTFEVYEKNFVKLNYDEYFDQNEVEIKSINVTEISKSLNIPKETTRRKINELEELGTIKRINKKIIIDRNTWPNIKPEESITRMTRFLSTLSRMCFTEGIISKPISSENLTKTCSVNEMVSISNSAMKLEEITLIFQSINPSTLAVKAAVTNALPNGKRTSHIFSKKI